MKIRNAILSACMFTISILPFGIIYLISDILSFFLARVFGYRRSVVYANLRGSGSEGTPQIMASKLHVYQLSQSPQG